MFIVHVANVGKNYNDEMQERFSADLHVHAQYPPAYIVYNADDNMVVPNLHSKSMKEALDKAGIKNIVEEGETGGHGFGCGFHTSVEDGLTERRNFLKVFSHQWLILRHMTGCVRC